MPSNMPTSVRRILGLASTRLLVISAEEQTLPSRSYQLRLFNSSNGPTWRTKLCAIAPTDIMMTPNWLEKAKRRKRKRKRKKGSACLSGHENLNPWLDKFSIHHAHPASLDELLETSTFQSKIVDSSAHRAQRRQCHSHPI
ncbi:hypothetical protein I7I48_04323 [Histoplasma ohiense]|nr:hypothetical protein I7I48_04323 [Histoplasma ohiense (nom. inval.)]